MLEIYSYHKPIRQNTVDKRCNNFKEMYEKGYLIQVERGLDISLDYRGNTLYYDATNPKAQKYLWDKVKENYYDLGIPTFWLDEAEPEYGVYDFDNYRYHIGTNMQVGNIYPVMYTKTFYDGLLAQGEKDILSLVRCAWAGSQKYGALTWSGDIQSTFEVFRCQVSAGLNMAMSGISWWTTDIGGLAGGIIEDENFRELFSRWFAYGAFCPVMRLHGSRDSLDENANTNHFATVSDVPNEIWSFGDKVFEICKKYIAIREKLKPYIKENMKKTHVDGTPIMRPLFYDFPNDALCWEIKDEYMFGEEMLVAPVMYANTEYRSVYLPKNQQWIDAWSGEKYDGGEHVKVKTPIDIIPVFLTTEKHTDIFK